MPEALVQGARWPGLVLALLLLTARADLVGLFEVHQYGAEGDGVHDDTAAIQAALDAAAANGGGTVSLGRRGPYLVSRPLVVCDSRPAVRWEDSFPPSSMHFQANTPVTLSSPAHSRILASPSWSAGGGLSGMILIGVQPDGAGCPGKPWHSAVVNLQLGGANYTPSAWPAAHTPPGYPLGPGPAAGLVASWAGYLRLSRNSITNVNIGLYLKGVDNAVVQENVIRANHAIVAEECGDSKIVWNDLYPFGWGVILRGWSGDTLFEHNVWTGQPMTDPDSDACKLARARFASPDRWCDNPRRMPASGGILIDNGNESCGWANGSAMLHRLWPNCSASPGKGTGLYIRDGQFHGLSTLVQATAAETSPTVQLVLAENNLMPPLGELGFNYSNESSGACEFTFACDRCACRDNVYI